MADSRQGGRRFTIADGMILIAATAAGIALSGRIRPEVWSNPRVQFDSWKAALYFASVTMLMGLPCLIAWTLTIPLLRIRGGFQSWRRVARRPGMAACLLVWLSLPLSVGLILGGQVYSSGIARFRSRVDLYGAASVLMEILWTASPLIGWGVAMGWSLQAIQGRWRAEPTWTDRAGRALGTIWIGIAAVIVVNMIVSMS